MIAFLAIIGHIARGFHSLGSSEKDKICGPEDKPLFTKFLISQWAQAKEVLGIELKNSSAGTAEELEYILTTFFDFHPGVKVFYTYTGIAVVYAVMWKCASEGITRNLNRQTTRIVRSTTYSIVHDTKSGVDALLEAMKSEWTASNSTNRYHSSPST